MLRVAEYMQSRYFKFLTIPLLLAACPSITETNLEKQYGSAAPRQLDRDAKTHMPYALTADQYLSERASVQQDLSLNLVWDGDGTSGNIATPCTRRGNARLRLNTASWISVDWRIDDGSSVSNGPTGQRGLFDPEPSPCCRTKMIDKLINCKRELP